MKHAISHGGDLSFTEFRVEIEWTSAMDAVAIVPCLSDPWGSRPVPQFSECVILRFQCAEGFHDRVLSRACKGYFFWSMT